ncbi:unnamed protein product [Ectocarpus sp. 12 AP-2014]
MWGEIMLTAAYLLNRSPHSALGGATPYKSPDLSGLRVIGARAFVHHERYRKKLETELSKASYVVSASTATPTGY